MATLSGQAMTWHKITLDFESSQTYSEAPATFRDNRLDVTFTNATTGEVYVVPGFFAADGDAANTGATSGQCLAGELQPAFSRVNGPTTANRSAPAPTSPRATAPGCRQPQSASPRPRTAARWTVAPTDKTGDDFRAKGMILQAEGEPLPAVPGRRRLLRARRPGRAGELPRQRATSTVPTSASPASERSEPGRRQPSRPPPVRQPSSTTTTATARPGTAARARPCWARSTTWPTRAMNTIYLLTNTVAGDGLRTSAPGSTRTIYDRSTSNTKSIEEAANATPMASRGERLPRSTTSPSSDQWETLFDHMDDKGIYKNILFQETENDQLLNGGTNDGRGLHPLGRASGSTCAR